MPRDPAPTSIRFDASWLTRAALIWVLSVVAARMMTTDAIREAFEVVPSGSINPKSPGPATGLMLDLLATFPALLVLARRVIDPFYPVRFRWSPILLAALAICGVASTYWASDTFVTTVTSLHLVAATTVVWTMSQLIRSWSQFRLVSAVAGGLLLVLVAQSVEYKFVEVPANREYWNENKSAILKSRNLEPGSFTANKFQDSMLKGDLIGFFNSVNTFATVGVLLFAACAGIGFFRITAGDSPNWSIATGVAIVSLIWILVQAKSKAAGVTPFVGLAVVAVWAIYGHRLKHVIGRTYLAAVGLILIAGLTVVGIGLKTGHLLEHHFSNSLDFRWKYWTASVGVFKDHPLLGVGYGNFGPFYLSHRLPEAAEEIVDPHNLIVRCFTELGVVGGLLLLAWIARLGWELLHPADESPDCNDRPPTTRDPMVIAGIAMLVAMIAKTDFEYPLMAQVMGLLPLLIYGLVLVFGTLAGSLHEPASNSIDPRPAKWIYTCLATGIGLFLLANMIDFSWGEPAALLTFAMLAGSAVGMTGAPIKKPMLSRAAPIAGITLGTIAWFTVAGAVVMPIIQAETAVATADNLIADIGPTDQNAGQQIRSAINGYKNAVTAVPYNADYRYQLARAETFVRDPAALVDTAAAIAGDPTRIRVYLFDAQLRLADPSPDKAAIIHDFDTAVRLDPNDIAIHQRYGAALDKLNMHDAAVIQYKAALDASDALPKEETRRLSPEEYAKLKSLAQRG